MSKRKLLLIDDEVPLLELLTMHFSDKGHEVKSAATATEGLAICRAFAPEIVILDIRLPDVDGLQVLQKLNRINKSGKTIMITAHHDMETTIKAMKLEAYDYVTKPIDIDELEQAVNKALRLSTSVNHEAITTSDTLQKDTIIGRSKQMQEIFKTIGILSGNKVTVLIEGETGTGKGLIAQAIHEHSLNKESPFLVVNCAAIVEPLFESELFGHEKGSFTGALFTRKGKFELAGKGTIFLDEVGDIPLDSQAKLLRFLQEKEFERVGGEKTLRAEARIIAATNRDLWGMVRESAFREDLFYRLSVARISVPPLRERREDIHILAKHILRKLCPEVGKKIRRIENKALMKLKEYNWPGNVRELENILTQAATAARSDVIQEEDITPCFRKQEYRPNQAVEPLRLEDAEKHQILKILEKTNWRLAVAAHTLGISRPTLNSKLKKYKIEPN
ncbi:MAG: sigma-54-dependent Fis family transcriptional regulator [Desulfobacteraceae bacterium]|nr:MAG: sigma-54-dependent Fis family transcriptional regulator [Desulfobacteraceae bacterium]